VLGFGTLQLSPDRDPLAPHAEPVPRGGVLLPELVRRGLVRGLPSRLVSAAPRISARSGQERAALGYLHANCGGCHDSVGPLAGIGLALRHRVGAAHAVEEPALAAVSGASRYQGALASTGGARWIEPGAAARSTVLARMSSRDAMAQMPPLGTQLVDAQAVALVRRWIDDDLKPEEGNRQH
jgi:hypothetical protein